MALDVDIVMDRRRLVRRAAVWRGLTIVAVVGAIAAFVATREGVLDTEHIARVPVTGAIVAERPLLQLIEKLRKDDSVAGVLVSINSPGGTSVGGERLYNALRELGAAKPTVAHINGLGASAAYMAALASDHIVAQRTALTGSIGVLIQFGQVERLLDKIGISVTKLESGPLKAEPSPFEPVDPAAIALLQSVVDDSFAYFFDLVVERRPLTADEAREVADGRIFTGHQAFEAKLIDAIGGEKTAIAWLETERGVTKDLPVRAYKPTSAAEIPLAVKVADYVLGRTFAAAGVTLPQFPEAGSVDGLWSLWHVRWPSDQ